MRTLADMLALGVALALLVPVPARAQSAPSVQPAAVTGTVSALNGEVLPGVAIAVTGEGGQRLAGTLSDERGRFRIAALPSGPLTMTASLAGFRDLEQRLVVAPGQELRVKLEMQLAAVTETVVVVPQASIELGASPGSAGMVDLIQMEEIPLADVSVQSALTLLPGVIRGPDGISIKGGRPTQSSLEVASAVVTEPATGDADFRLPADAVASIEVLPNPYAVEFGRFSSGLTVIQTRKGGNAWRLSASELNPALRTRRGRPLDVLGVASFTPRITVGGPVLKDRVFLAQSVQYRYSSRDVSSRPQSELTRREGFGSYTRLDVKVSETHSLTGSFAVLPDTRDFANLGTFDPPEVTVNTRQRVYDATVTERATLTPATFLESTLHANFYHSQVEAQQEGEMEMLPEGNRGSFFNGQARDTSGLQWREVLSGVRQTGGGTHFFKVGIDILRIRYDGSSTSRPVNIRRLDGTLAQRITFDRATGPRASSTDFAAFAQDRWQLNARLLLEAGVRVDRDGVAGRTNASPRLGVRVQPLGDERVTIGGGVGRFVERTPLTVGAFEMFEARTISRFETDGLTPIGRPIQYQPEVAPDLRTPYSLTWNIEYDQRVGRTIFLRANYLDRTGRDEYIVEQRSEADEGYLTLSSRGRSAYRELSLALQYSATPLLKLSVSYVRARSRADLNAHSAFFGNIREPVVRANEYGPTDTEVPHRFLGQARLQAGNWRAGSLVEWRSGFPFSAVDAEQQFVGPRNVGYRFPAVIALDLSVERRIKLGKLRPYIGLQLLNALNRFTPRDVQRNLASPLFGSFYNSDPRRLRLIIRGL